MAIQVRRGDYADLDTSKLQQGEPFITLDEVGGSPYVGMAISPSNVVRLASYDDIAGISIDVSNSEAWAVGKRDGIPVSDTDPTYHNNSKYYANMAQTAWESIDDAVQIVTPSVDLDFTTGQLQITGGYFEWEIDSNGHLTWELGV